MISGILSNLLRKPKKKGMSVSDTTMPEPSLWRPISQACTHAQLDEAHYAHWCSVIREEPRMHRKQWEFAYILQSLQAYDMLEDGRRGLGFGVGTEPITAVCANAGASILATDLDVDEAVKAGWVETNQHLSSKHLMNHQGICDPDRFERLVDFRVMDMNKIDRDLRGQFDFTWSACAFEHLGSIAQGLDFVINSVKCLKPGGLAVHTTEFNCSSNSETVDNKPTVLFRKRDMELLAQHLRAEGCKVEFNFNLGEKPLDRYVDVPPYRHHDHLKIQIENYIVTSFGLLIQKL